MKAVKSLLGGKKKNTPAAAAAPAPAVTPDKLPVMERNVADLPEPESNAVKLALLDVLLSPASCTEKEEDEEEKEMAVLEPPEIQVTAFSCFSFLLIDTRNCCESTWTAWTR